MKVLWWGLRPRFPLSTQHFYLSTWFAAAIRNGGSRETGHSNSGQLQI
ncbi:MAG: hypothetical protein IPL78_17075 [Chloroflexi bacterium]|nr:hypothetical protein [Chloroflexota bacterium]